MNVLLSPPVGGWSSRNRGAAHTRGRSCIHWVTPVAPRRAAHRGWWLSRVQHARHKSAAVLHTSNSGIGGSAAAGCRRHRALGPAAAKALPVKDCQVRCA